MRRILSNQPLALGLQQTAGSPEVITSLVTLYSLVFTCYSLLVALLLVTHCVLFVARCVFRLVTHCVFTRSLLLVALNGPEWSDCRVSSPRSECGSAIRTLKQVPTSHVTINLLKANFLSLQKQTIFFEKESVK